MDDINVSYYRGRFEYVEFDSKIPEGDFARFVVLIIEWVLKTFQLENKTFSSSKDDKKSYSLQKMASLVYYSFARGFTKASVISDMAKNHTYFQYVANGIEPDEDTVNDFINKWGSFFEYLVPYTVQFAILGGLTNIENISVDSTYAKSANNKFNVIHKEDVEILINYLSSKFVSEDELKSLRHPAKRFLKRQDITNKKKLKKLNKILERFEETGANTIPINDIDSIHITNKQGNADVGYNIQTAVDNASKMFIALIVSQKATDHHQFPDIVNKVIENIGQKPNHCNADAAYNTRRTLEYIIEMELDALIDNNRSAKLRNGRKNKNKFHKDNMPFNYEEQYFICYNNEKLTRQRTTCRWDAKKEDFDIFIEFWNKEACSNCEFAEDCCNGKHRVVKISGGDLALDMETKFQDYLNILKYVTRFSTVEAPNGTLKVFFHVNEFLSAGLEKFQNRINICGGTYNLIRLYNQLLELNGINQKNILNVTREICEKTNIIMTIWRNTTLPYFEEKLLLPYKCQSIIEEELRIKAENNNQTVLC